MQYKDENEKPDKLGAIVYAAMFTVYIGAMVALAILGVPYLYFFAILIAGIPVSGVTLSILQGTNWLKSQKVVENTTVAIDRSDYTNEAGHPVIRL